MGVRDPAEGEIGGIGGRKEVGEGGTERVELQKGCSFFPFYLFLSFLSAGQNKLLSKICLHVCRNVQHVLVILSKLMNERLFPATTGSDFRSRKGCIRLIVSVATF